MKNLIFDFDGVLADTWAAVIHGIVESGREPDQEAAIRNATTYATKGSHHTKDHTLTDEEMTAEHEWVRRFGEIVYRRGFELFHEFVSAVEALEEARVAVVSSGSQSYVLPALAKTNLNPTHVLAFEDHHSKEEKIRHVCLDWGVPVSDVYYFTDTLADVYELKNLIAADKLIGVAWGYCGKELLLQELEEAN
ncbi:HAD family phosphatase, partial [Candidatus Kaiserbacteria bacterium]|nr:HAD family phosphatase [Candidatus Kaiserbacteria bacterium]